MARKQMASLEEHRAEIKKKYRRGKKSNGTTARAIDSLGEIELAVVRESACIYKAAGFSHSYIADALDLTVNQVRTMFAEESMATATQKHAQNFVDGAVKLLKTYAIELIEMLVHIARTADDEKVALSAITEALDRIGITKVNKSDSVVTNVSQVDFTDKTGLIERTRSAPPEIQQQLARHAEEMLALAQEHAEPEAVTA